jgi:hypothetical protein
LKKDEKLPDLPDIMAAGYGLSEALAWWSAMMNARDRTPQLWWDKLVDERKKRLQ